MSAGLHLLDGIRVISLESYISAPYCTSLLADAGAEVIKVERPGAGDPRRYYQPDRVDADGVLSGGFASYNRGKKSVELDLATDAGRERFGEMLATADVLVSNLRPGSLGRLGLDRATCAELYPHLVVCEVSGFGQTGPYAQWPAFDSVIQAMSGLSSLLGPSPEEPPELAPMATMDILGGVYSTVGILMALVSRQTTGRGTHVDASMYDIGAAFLERPLTLHEFTGEVPLRGQDRFSPVGSFRAGDGGWISLVIPTDEMWRRCCEAIGRPELETDPELDTVLKRAERMKDLVVPALEQWASAMTRDEAAAVLRASGQPAGVVRTIDEVRNDEHLRARGLFQPVDDPRAGAGDQQLRLPRLPLLFDGEGAAPGPIPKLGGDNAEFGA